MFDPYGWTRPGPPLQPHRPSPARWFVSTLAALAAGAAAFGATLVTYTIALMILGLDSAIPAGVGGIVALLAGVVAAAATWRGIRARWDRPGRDTTQGW